MSGRRIEVHTMTLKTESALNSSNPNDVKFGVIPPVKDIIDTKGELVLLPHDKPLSYAVEIVCERFSFKDPTEYALKFSEPPSHYVTESTRKELSGKLVSLNFSPEKVSREIVEVLKGNVDATITTQLARLAENAADPTVADVFVSHNGLNVLLELLERDKITTTDWYKDAFAYALQALLDIMLLSSEASWDRFSSAAVTNVTCYVNSFNKSCSNKALGPALQVLENAVTSGLAYTQVDKEVTLPVLITHVQNADAKVQQNALALINALFGKADANKRKAFAATLMSRKYRDIIMQNVVRKAGERPSETNHELYVMQTLFLNILDEKRLTAVEPQDQEAQNKIKELFKIAFETESATYSIMSFDTPSHYARRDKSSNQRDYQKLGFSNEKAPALDFAVVPPGALALDCMYHLATTHADEYSKIVLESSSRTTGDECPFARSSIALVNVLCEILKIGEPPSDQQGKFYPFFFQHDKAFEELYCICALTVTKTWKEMRAAAEDFDKVFDVVSDQIRRALEKLPETFESLKSLLNSLSYNEIIRQRTEERSYREKWELKAKPIQDLREKIKPQIIELIKQNRINYLIAGTRFNRFTSKTLVLTRTKDKFWFCRLSPNAKVFHYGDCDEKATPLPEELQSKINVLDIKDLVTGKDCPHIKEAKSKKGGNVPLAFSIVTEKETSTTVDFIAPDDKTFDLWTDGINALLGKEMVSKEAEQDLDILLHMEIKLRLLEIEGIPELPQEPPPIPELPEDFDFAAVQAQFAGNKYVVFN